MKNRCLLLDAQHRMKIIEREIPRAQKGEVVVKIAANGICGSDVHFFKEAKLGNFVVTEPYIPGHEASGTVFEVGEGVKDFGIGDRVVIEPGIPCGFCKYCKSGRYNLCGKVKFLSAPPIDGTFCDYVSVDANFLFKIPDHLDLESAALVEPTAVAVHAVNRAGRVSGATGVILGAGTIGLLVQQAFKSSGGGYTICVDILDSRLEKAKELGADMTVNPLKDNMDLSSISDIVFETAGSSITTGQLINIAKPGGRIVQVGWPETQKVLMDIAAFLDKELTYAGVNRYANAYPTAITWIADNRIKVKEVVSHRFTFDNAVEAFEHARDNPSETIKVLVVN